MELKDYTIEELKAEIKRRAEISRVQKAEEMKTALRCRNCKHCAPNRISKWTYRYMCMARIWGKKYPRHYTITLSTKGCDKFERKDE